MIELVWEEGSERRAVYNSVAEALLQAAHNELTVPGRDQRVEKDGKQVHGKQAIRSAAKRLREHRDDQGFGRGAGFDAAAELRAVST